MLIVDAVSSLASAVIIEGTNDGLFVYSGTPVNGNPPILWAVSPGVTADPYGNTVTAVLGVGVPGGAGMQVDATGDVTLTGPDGSTVTEMPEQP